MNKYNNYITIKQKPNKICINGRWSDCTFVFTDHDLYVQFDFWCFQVAGYHTFEIVVKNRWKNFVRVGFVTYYDSLYDAIWRYRFEIYKVYDGLKVRQWRTHA